jgi:hypothetical protein
MSTSEDGGTAPTRVSGPRAPALEGNNTVEEPSFIEIGPWGPDLPIGPTIFASAAGAEIVKLKTNRNEKVSLYRRFFNIPSPFRLPKGIFCAAGASTKWGYIVLI